MKKKDYMKLDTKSENCCSVIDKNDGSTFLCYSYQKNLCKYIVYYLSCFLTVGFLSLITYWKPNWKLYLTCSKCPLENSDKVLLEDSFGNLYVENISKTKRPAGSIIKKRSTHSPSVLSGGSRVFIHKHIKYYFDPEYYAFSAVETFEENVLLSDIHKITSSVVAEAHRNDMLIWFGKNIIDVKVKPYVQLFFEECADPFYIFQILSCILWFLDEYYYYAAAIVFISVVSIFISIYQMSQYLITLRNMIAKSSIVKVLAKSGEIVELLSEDLVPGDVLVIPKNGGYLFCDAALMSGTVIVNESMLTGESVPVTKTPLPVIQNENDINNIPFNSIKHKRHTLFCGTEVLQTRYYGNENVLAVVVNTGFTTMKGELVRSILFPKPVDFKFFNDAIKFIGILGIFAVMGLTYSIYINYVNGIPLAGVIKKSLDVITIAVPPALPAAMSVGTVYAVQRLKKQKIFCISPSHINISGKTKLFCFDKTGTLTEDGLDYCGVMAAASFDNDCFSSLLQVHSDNDQIIAAMATCHSLTLIDGEICGDPLDFKMFHATGWDIEEGGACETERYGQIIPAIVKPKSTAADALRMKYFDEDSYPLEIAILKQYTFSSELQRMSVVVRRLGKGYMEVYSKGSPEMIASLCRKSSLPKNFDQCLHFYAKQGYRVLALAYKNLSVKVKYHKLQLLQRNEAEIDLIFLGFLIMKNRLKPETIPTIEKLHYAQIRTVMVTGDNLLTAASVARESKMVQSTEKILSININGDEKPVFSVTGELDEHIDVDTDEAFARNHFLRRNYHLAVTGKTFAIIETNYPKLFEKLLVCGTIFARMLPDQKTLLVESLQKLGYGVGMCGDGANDCGALKRAHCGISLSEAEASVASPFTSKVANISCVIDVIKEGRCALVTAFNIFKYMALYSMIEFTSALILYSIKSNLGDFQYLYIDLFLITSFAVTLSRSGPIYDKFTAQRPLGRLLHPFVLFSLIMQIIVQIVFQVLCFWYVKTIPQYKNIDYFYSLQGDPSTTMITCYENTILFNYSSFQYIIVAIVFSAGKPFRQPFYRNALFLLAILLYCGINCVITVKPATFIQNILQVLYIDNWNYYLVFFGLLLCNLLASYIVDHVILNAQCMKQCLKALLCKKLPRNPYKVILSETNNDTTWPPKDIYEEPRVLC